MVKKMTSLRRKYEHKDSDEGTSLDDTWGKNVPGEGTASGDVLRQRVPSKGEVSTEPSMAWVLGAKGGEAAGIGPDGGRCSRRDGKKPSHLLYHVRLMYGKLFLLFSFLVQALLISAYS